MDEYRDQVDDDMVKIEDQYSTLQDANKHLVLQLNDVQSNYDTMVTTICDNTPNKLPPKQHRTATMISPPLHKKDREQEQNSFARNADKVHIERDSKRIIVEALECDNYGYHFWYNDTNNAYRMIYEY